MATRRRPAIQTVSDLAEIRTRVEERHAETQRRFDAVDARQASMDLKLDSLLASRSFMRGLWRSAAVISAVVGSIVSIIVSWVRGN